jgi:imidazolonepropionase-like amidohydrolase
MPYVRHGTNAYELEMLVEAGLSPMEAIVACTSGAAAAIDFPEVGSVRSGKFADLVLVDADPLADIRALQRPEHIKAVIKGGRFVKGAPAAALAAQPAARMTA